MTSEGKLIVHIGLPKTATTTLQSNVFPNFPKEKFEYHGVNQPREKNISSEFYNKFYVAVASGANINDIRTLLKNELKKGKVLIISEEMITVSSSGATWKEKLKNLAVIVNDFNYEIIVTVREPASAMFSYYCEFYPMFSRSSKNFMDCALNHEDMQIFHYKILTEKLQESFEYKRLHVFQFEDIIKGKIKKIIEVIDPNGVSASVKFKLEQHNSRKKTSHYITTRYSSSPLDFVRNLVDYMGLNNTKFFLYAKSMLQPLISRINKIKINDIKVERPSNNELIYLKQSLEEETKNLEVLYGVKYE